MTREELLRQLDEMESELREIKHVMQEDEYSAQLVKKCDARDSQRHFNKLVKRDFEDLFHFDEPF